ncbi:MAG: UDP-N-acetylmuramate dehydrogenase [Zoogloeaceae bacterium]|jgi:UDP-N-acetylmuramate dehydrogenase|nr:UDP-N-acetylmuramate dehydrogenase [Zoogloeaceae bacterium]
MHDLFQYDADLTALNTFRLPACARTLLRLRTVDDARAFAAARHDDDPLPLILGGGSNLVLGGGPLAVVLKVEIGGRRKLGEDGDMVVVEAGAGESWHDFVRWTLVEGWPGLENLALIPGTVGAAPIQNIGAYGLEMAERFDSLTALDLGSGEVRQFDAAACRFGYRESVFKHAPGRWLVVAVRFRLPRRWQPRLDYGELGCELAARGIVVPTPLQVFDTVAAIRRRKLPDPAELGSVGSFFKNPLVDTARAAALLAVHPELPHYPQPDGRVKLAAGWLIERCGWKGRRLGSVGCHSSQALVLVNHGGATGADVLELAARVRGTVRERFGVDLEIEPVVIFDEEQ